MASSSSEDGNRLHSMINELEKKAQWALSNILRFFIKQLKTTSQHADTALAEYLNNNPIVLKDLCKIMMKDNKKLFYEDDGCTIRRIIKISAFDATLLAKLLLNIPDFETCYAKSDGKRKAKKCGDLNHAKNKGCCVVCDHKGDGGESYCKQCRKSKFLCSDNTYVCCSKCTLCVCCSENLATPQCPISTLRFAIYITKLLRDLKSHTSLDNWSHISRNEWIPLEFEFCGKTCEEIWEVCKEQVEYLYKFLKSNRCISEVEYNKHIHVIFQLEHLTITEQMGSIAKDIIKKESTTVNQKNLKIKIAIFCLEQENSSFLSKLENMLFGDKQWKLLAQLFSKSLDSELVYKMRDILKKTTYEKLDELANRTGKPVEECEVICSTVKKTYDKENKRDEFHLAVCIKLKSGQDINHSYESPHSDLSTELWNTFKYRVTEMALNDLKIYVDLTRSDWRISSIIITLKIARLSAGGFDIFEKNNFAYLIQELPNQDSFFAPYIITASIKNEISPKEKDITLSFSCEVNDDSMYQKMMDIYPGFEKELQKHFRETMSSQQHLQDTGVKLKQYAFEDPQEINLNLLRVDEEDSPINSDWNDVILQRAINSICKISHTNGSIFGVLISFRSWGGGEIIFGVVTGRHFLYFQFMEDGELLEFEVRGKSKLKMYLRSDTFRFTCPMLDVTFLRLGDQQIHQLQSNGAAFLEINDKYVHKGDVIYHVKEMGKNMFSYNVNTITTCWGCTIQQNLKDTDVNSIEHIFEMSMDGKMEAVCLRRKYVDKVLSSVRGSYIVYALNILLNYPVKKKSICPFGPAKRLDSKEIHELSKMGLQITQNEYLFISPEGFMVTTLWFYRSNHCWYWTPTEPKSYTNMDDLRYCNWLQIGFGKSMKVLGGPWQDCEPAQRNILLLNKLAETGLKYLVE